MQNFFKTEQEFSKIKTKMIKLGLIEIPILILILIVIQTNSYQFIEELIMLLIIAGFFIFPILVSQSLIWLSCKISRFRFFNIYLNFIIFILKEKESIKNELKYLENYFKNTFGEDLANSSIEYLTEKFNGNDDIYLKHISYDSKDIVQLLNTLIATATCENKLDENQKLKIYEVAKYLSFPKKTVDKIISKYIVIEPKYEEYTNYNYSKFYSKSKLSSAFETLGIPENSTLEQVKLAYRNLVKKHHPDRVAYLGEDAMLKAKEMFQKIQAAYEIIEKEF